MSASKKKAVIKSNLVERASTIRRHSAPTIYDQYPKGTTCIVAEKELYIQNAQDENNPCWELMGPYTPPTEFLYRGSHERDDL